MKKDALKNEEIDVNDINFEKLMIIYRVALEKAKILLVNLQEETNTNSEYNGIDKIFSRIKKPDSIIDKMLKKGYPLTYQSLIENINDIAGIRIICNSNQEIYKVVDKIENIKEIKILNKKDYIKNPKESGYSAYHIIIEVPIYLQNNKVWVKVEIQIRTLSMDSWANIEHGVSYKGTTKISNKDSRNILETKYKIKII